MKITINNKVLQNALKSLKTLVPSTSLQPVLKNFLFKSEDDILTITASNMESSLSVKLNVSTDDQSERIFLIDSTFFLKMVSSIKDENIILESDEEFTTCAIHTKKGILDFVVENADLYPELFAEDFEGKPEIKVKTDLFLSAIKTANAFQATDDLRPQFKNTNIKVISTGQMFVYATDIHKIIRLGLPIETEGISFSMLVPPAVTRQMQFIGGEEYITIVKGERRTMLKNNSMTFCFTDSEFAFPNCDAVIPQPTEYVLTTTKDDFIETMKQVQVLSVKDSSVVKFSNEEGRLSLSISDLTMGRNADVNFDAKDVIRNTILPNFAIGFDADYMLEVVNAVSSSHVSLHFKDQRGCILIKETDKDCKENENIDICIMPKMI